MGKSIKNSLLFLLLSTVCMANEPSLPSINEAPLFWSFTQNDPRYKTAAFKAQEAFFIQTGFTSDYNKAANYINNRLIKVAKIVEIKTAELIDEETPLNSRHVFLAVGVGYAIAAKKEITQGFKSPFFKNVSHTVTVSKDRQLFGVQILF